MRSRYTCSQDGSAAVAYDFSMLSPLRVLRGDRCKGLRASAPPSLPPFTHKSIHATSHERGKALGDFVKRSRESRRAQVIQHKSAIVLLSPLPLPPFPISFFVRRHITSLSLSRSLSFPPSISLVLRLCLCRCCCLTARLSDLLVPPSSHACPPPPHLRSHRCPHCCAVFEVTSSSSSIIAQAKTSS